jgi:intracellular multiplication protein IcmF
MKIFNHRQTTHADAPEPTALLQAVDESLVHVLHYLKLRQTHHARKVRQSPPVCPYFVVLGPSGSGKSALLNQADLAEVHTLGQENALCRAWVSTAGIYFKINGRCISNTDFLPAWPGVSKRLNKRLGPIHPLRSHQHPFGGILLVLNLSELMRLNPLQLSATLNDYVAGLLEFTDAVRQPVPVHLTLTHMDGINGFTEFFAELTDAQSRQRFGFEIVPTNSMEESLTSFTQSYHQLIKQLEQQLIKRLHHTSSNAQRVSISNFPRQLDSLTAFFQDLLEKLFFPDAANCNYVLQSFNGCSNFQHEPLIECLSKPLQQSFNLPLPVPHYTQHQRHKAYFSHGLLSELAQSALQCPQKNQSNLARVGIVAISLMALTVGSLVLINNFKDQIVRINTDATAVRNYQANAKALAALPPPLHFIKQTQALYQLHTAKATAAPSLTFTQHGKLQQRFDNFYQQQLQQQFLPQLGQQINDYLQRLKPNQAEKKYATLKAYLMLGYSQHMDLNYFLAWLQNYWVDQHGQQLPAVTVQQLQTILQDNFPVITIDMNTVTATRHYINSLPNSFVAYLLLKDRHTEAANSYQGMSIPSIYQRHSFVKIYKQELKKVSETILQGNWILGKQAITVSKQHDFINELRELYLEDYQQWWLEFIERTHFSNQKQLAQLAKTVKTLNASKTSLATLLHLIKENTAMMPQTDPIAELFNDIIASQFTDINRFTQEHTQQLSDLIRSLDQDLAHIIHARDPKRAAFEYARREFQNKQTTLEQSFVLAAQAPMSIQNWFKTLLDNTWQAILFQTRQYIEQQWRTTVYQEYIENIRNHYPFGNQAEVGLEQFNHFFAAQGTLNQFYTSHVEPFLQANQADWHNKPLHGQQLSFSNTAIEQFIRTHLIQKMFFPQGGKRMAFQFKIAPLQFSPDVKEVIINLDGQHHYGYPGSTQSNTFTWPYQNHNHHVTITLTTKQDQHVTLHKQGDWALFRLFEHYPLEAKNPDAADYVLTLPLEEYTTKFRITADTAINPLLPNILGLLDLPEHLTVAKDDETATL